KLGRTAFRILFSQTPTPPYLISFRLNLTRSLPHLVSISFSVCSSPLLLIPTCTLSPAALPHLSLHRLYALLRIPPSNFAHPRTQPTRASSDSQSDTISCPHPPTRIQGSRHRTRPTPRLDWTSWLQAKHALEWPPPSVPLPFPSVSIPFLLVSSCFTPDPDCTHPPTRALSLQTPFPNPRLSAL
ncbi:hypothetical protein B0H14DRAFT_3853761, partial [Mycena olivaceomarginata]